MVFYWWYLSSAAHDCYKAAGLEALAATNIKILCKPSLGNERRFEKKRKKKVVGWVVNHNHTRSKMNVAARVTQQVEQQDEAVLPYYINTVWPFITGDMLTDSLNKGAFAMEWKY